MKTTASEPISQNSNRVFLALGSNLGNRNVYLDRAEALVSERVGAIVARSSRLKNAAVGFSTENDFLNEVIEVETVLPPDKLLSVTESIERELGRSAKSSGGRYGDRVIDIDIIYYSDEIINSLSLTVPHPRIAERLFVLVPLNEIAPELKHPVTGKSTAQMLAALNS